MHIRASLTEDCGTRLIEASLPLGAIARVAKHEPKIRRLFQRLGSHDATLEDLMSVLRAAIAAEDDIRHLIEFKGLVAAEDLAARLLFLALTDDPDAPSGNAVTASTAET